MRLFPLLAAVFMAPSAALAQKPPAPVPASHVLVVSVDGFGASELRGKPSCLPEKSTIRALAESGAWSRGVIGILPTITYPTHATLSTGRTPVGHGVVDNGIAGRWFDQRSNIAGPALWDAARKAGRSVAIVTWPSTYGADADWLVPEDLNNHAVATETIRKGSTPGLFDALAKATVAPQLLPFSHKDAGLPLDEMTARFAAEVVRRHKPHLLLAHFLDYDHRMHSAPWSKEACAALERTDAWIAHILEAYRSAGILDRTTVFVVSDHGFLEVKRQVNVSALLRESGLAELFPDKDVSAAFSLKMAGGSAAFYPGLVSGAEAGRRLARKMRPLVEKRYGQQVRWITPQQARAMGGFPDALFSLCARPGYSLTAIPGTEVILDRGTPGLHGYCPDEPAMDAVFIASGYGVGKTGALPKMGVVDVGPTIASFLGVRMPEATGRDRSAGLRVRTRPEPSPAR